MRADKIVTIKEPKIIGRAPNCFPEGFQVCPKRKSKMLTPLTKKVDKPFWATKIKIIATMITIKERQVKVKPLPNFSRREFFEGESNFLDNSS